jgi:hypothetical protein
VRGRRGVSVSAQKNSAASGKLYRNDTRKLKRSELSDQSDTTWQTDPKLNTSNRQASQHPQRGWPSESAWQQQTRGENPAAANLAKKKEESVVGGTSDEVTRHYSLCKLLGLPEELSRNHGRLGSISWRQKHRGSMAFCRTLLLLVLDWKELVSRSASLVGTPRAP